MALRVANLTTERRIDPLGIDEPWPRFGWQMVAGRRGLRQAGYRIQLGRTPAALGASDTIWDTGDVASADSNAVPYAGPGLRSRQRCCWRVQVVNERHHRSPWSRVAWFEMGLLRPADWQARWIGYVATDPATEAIEVGEPKPPSRFRRQFSLDAGVSTARAYVSALGIYELRLNGRRVGDQELTPGWTDYRRRVQYQTFDVTELLQQGHNVVAVVLADGWYAGSVGWFGRQHYGDSPALIMQLEVELTDGRRVAAVTDASWHARPSTETIADLLAGERIDLRTELDGWDRPGFDDSDWPNAQLRAGPGVPLVAQRDDGVHVIADLAPVLITSRADGTSTVDFGQNIAGRVRFEANGSIGSTISIRHGEVLDSAGDLYTANLRTAEARDEIRLSGAGPIVVEPRFTFHGFRYAEVAGDAGRMTAERISARAISSATRLIGTFECSEPIVNAIFRNATWSLRDNFIGIPMDCPQRDERMGWTGDIQVFAASALFMADIANTLEKWLIDLSDGQLPSGAYPDVAPAIGNIGSGSAGWADAGVLVPWAIYEATGDRRVLERQFGSIRRYLEFLSSDHTGGIRAAAYGDWLSLGPATPKTLVGTAYLAHTASIASRTAATLGELSNARRFEHLSRVARDAFQVAFIEPDGRIVGDTQTGYALALGFDLLPERFRRNAAARLATLVEAADTHLLAGFLGSPLVMSVLSRNDYHDLACRLIIQTSPPSWGAQIAQGATTNWERWDGWTPSSGFADPLMNSFNHFAFGAVAEWLVRHLAGLSSASPGYAQSLIDVRVAAPFTFARVQHESQYGTVGVEWMIDGSRLSMTTTIPPNTTGLIRLHRAVPGSIAVNTRRPRLRRPTGEQGGDAVDVAVGSGRHLVKAELVL